MFGALVLLAGAWAQRYDRALGRLTGRLHLLIVICAYTAAWVLMQHVLEEQMPWMLLAFDPSSAGAWMIPDWLTTCALAIALTLQLAGPSGNDDDPGPDDDSDDPDPDPDPSAPDGEWERFEEQFWAEVTRQDKSPITA